jgi:general secretion pathway protein D
MGREIVLSAFSHLARSRTLALLALCLAALVPAAAPASAQQFTPITRPPTYPVALTAIKLLSENASESRFEFDFAPTATTYAPAQGAPNQPGVGFASTRRASTARQPAGLKGLVRSLDFQQIQDILIVRFNATKTATFSAVQTSDKALEITIRSGDYRAGIGNDQILPPPPPPAASYEPPSDYALVLLKYADVSEVVGLLTDGQTVKSNDVFIPSEPAFGSNSLTGNTYQPQAQTQAPGANDDPLGQNVDASIGIDRRLNAIWLKGTPERIAQLKQMISAIDIPVDSVVLETQFVELTEQGLKALGLDFNNANGQLGVVTFQTGQFIPPGVPAGSHLTSTQFQLALYAQISKGNGRIVSRPRISAQSGSTAKIITGDALPILTSIALSGVNGVSQQVQYVNVGVTLQIAPRVSGDGWVSSHVFAVVSSVTGTSQGYPTISQREAETSATVRDGDSFVIGGLTQDETISTKSKVPLLGDIPLIGLAFRNERTTRSKTELYIIVTPHVVHRVGSNPNIVPANAPLYAPPAATAPLPPPSPAQQPALPQAR